MFPAFGCSHPRNFAEPWPIVSACFVAVLLSVVFHGIARAEESRPDSSAPVSLETLVSRLDAAKTPEERVAIAGKLASYGKPAEAAVADLLDDSDPAVRYAAMEALRTMPRPYEAATQEALYACLGETVEVAEIPLWVPAAMLLGWSGGPGVDKAVTELSRISDDATGTFDDERAMRLCTLLYEAAPNDSDAAKALGKTVARGGLKSQVAALAVLVRLGKNALPAKESVRQALYAENFHAQYWACRVLAKIGPEAADTIPDLIDRLENGAVSVRRNAAIALGRVGTKDSGKVVPPLIAALDDPMQPVREQACWSLGYLGKDAADAAVRLEKAIEDGDIYPHSAPVWALWKITGKPPQVEIVLKEFKDVTYRPTAALVLLDFGLEIDPIESRLEEWSHSNVPPEESEDLRPDSARLLELLRKHTPSGLPAAVESL
ncbi:hypothetical protein JCM19992_10430 [Thermostilla marina]